jgi:hypothetical protein
MPPSSTRPGVNALVAAFHLIKRRRRWCVMLMVPPDVRAFIGQAITTKVPTGRGRADHRQGSGADQGARDAGRRLERVAAEQLAERWRGKRVTRITDVVGFVHRRVTISHHRCLPFRS